MIWAFMLERIMKFMLISVRMGAFIVTLPLFGGRVIPARYKAGLASLMALIVFGFVEVPYEPDSLFSLFLLIGQEVLLGLILGLVCTLIFEVFRTAGSYMGIEMGFRMVNVIDPYNSSKFTLIDAFLYFFSILVFLSINGHFLLIEGIIQSFKVVPIGGIVLSPDFGRAIITNFSWMIYFSILIAMPIVAAVLIVHVALGIVAKTAPRIPIFLMSFPVKIGLGLLMMSVIFPGIALLMSMVYSKMYTELVAALRMLS